MFPPRAPLPTIASTILWMRWPFELMAGMAKRYGEPFTIRMLGYENLVVIWSPENVKAVFADDGETFLGGRFNKSLAALLGDKSVLMLDGREHLRHRKLLMAPFHGERMQRYGQAMLDETDRTIDAWREDETFALHPSTQDITLRVIVRTVFGLTEGPRQAEMIRRMKTILRLGSWPPLLVPAMQRDLGKYSPWGRFRRAIEHGDAYLYEEIRNRRRTGERGDDILSLLLDARDENGTAMTDEELRDELVTLLVAGHETTATAMTWAVRWTLAQPALLARVRHEIAEACTRDGTKLLTAARAADLPLVDAIAREAMRLNPVIPLVGRVLDRPASVAGYDLPAGTPVACSIVLAHRREAAYPNATRFDPDRFLGKKISPTEFFPFGGGVRRCIGMAFALFEMRIVLARLFERADLSLAPRGEIKVQRRSITLMPSDGLLVRLGRRASTPSANP